MRGSTTLPELPEAPVYRPTLKQWSDPLVYIESIRPEAEVYGICRIVPPDGWKPPFALDKDEFVFETRKQDLNQLEGQNRLRRQFFDMLSSFHTGRGVPMAKKRIQRREVDPYELHRLIQEFGGVDYVTEKRLWSNIGEAMGFDRMVCTSLGFQLREAYEVLLRPYEVFVAERKAENEKIRNEKNTIFKSKRVLANASASSLAARATKAVLPDSEKDSNELASGLKSNKRICPANRRRNNTEPTTSVDSVPRVSSAPRPRRAAQQLTYQSQCYNDGRDKAVVKKIYNSALSDNRLEIFESALGRLGSNKITSEIIRGLPMPKSGRNSPCFQSTAKPDGRQSHIPPQAQPLRQAQVRPQLLPCPQAQVQLPSRMQPQSEVQVRSDSQSQSQGQEQFIPVPMSEAKRQTQAQLQARPGVQVESHPQVQPKLQAQLQQQMPTQGTQTQPGDTQAHPQPQSQTLLRPQTPTQLQSEPQLTSQLQPQPKPQPQLQSQPQSQPQLQSQPKPQPQLQSQPQQLPQPQLQPQPHTHPQPQQGQAQPPISSQQQPQPQPQLQQSRLIGQSPPGQIQTRPHPHPLPPSQSHPHPDSQPQQQVQPCTDHINESPSVLKAIEVALRARRANSSVPVGGAIALPSKPQNSVSSASNISTAAQPQGLATKQAPTAAQNRLTPGAPPTQTPNLIPNPNQILNPNRVSNSNPNSNLNSKPTPHAQVNVGVQGYIRMPAAVPVYSHAQTHWQRAPVQPRMPFPRQAAVHPHTGLTAQTDIRPQQTGVRPHPGIPLQPGVRPLGFPHLSQHPPPRPHEPYMHAQAQLHYNAHMRAMQQHPLMRGPHPHPGVGMGHMPIMPVQYGMQRAPLCAQGVAGIAQKAGRSTNGMPLATAISPTETGGVKDNRANNGSSGNTKGGGKRKAEKTPTSKGAKGPKAKKRNRIRSDTGQGGVLVTSTRSGRTTKHLKSAYTCDLESSDSFDSDYGDMYEYVPAGTRKTPTAQKKRARTPTSTQKPTHQSPAPAQAMAKAQAAVQGSSIDHASSSPDHPTKANTNASVQRVTGRARGRVVSREGSLQPGEFCKACEQSHDDDQILLCDGGYGCNNGYHMYCLRPPLDRVPSGIWICPECLELRCKQAELDKDYSFGSGKTRRIKEFQIFADSFAAKVMGTDSPSIAEVEKQFWGLLNNPFHEMAVEYGADLHSKTLGSGFPCYSHHSEHLGRKYADDGWNLNNMPMLYNSLFGVFDQAITGMTVPWMYIGMIFSTFAWHVEDHYTYSINYNHFGAPKTWYGVPGSMADRFDEVFKNTVPELFEAEPDLMNHLVTILNPSVFVDKNISVCRTDQREGEFVITFPQAYHAGFNQGFNFAEAVNFAPVAWLPWGLKSAKSYRKKGRAPVFSFEEIIFCAGIRHESMTPPMARSLATTLEVLINEEDALRKALCNGQDENAIKHWTKQPRYSADDTPLQQGEGGDEPTAKMGRMAPSHKADIRVITDTTSTPPADANAIQAQSTTPDVARPSSAIAEAPQTGITESVTMATGTTGPAVCDRDTSERDVAKTHKAGPSTNGMGACATAKNAANSVIVLVEDSPEAKPGAAREMSAVTVVKREGCSSPRMGSPGDGSAHTAGNPKESKVKVEVNELTQSAAFENRNLLVGDSAEDLSTTLTFITDAWALYSKTPTKGRDTGKKTVPSTVRYPFVFEKLDDDLRPCYVCHQTCFFSSVTCIRCDERERMACLQCSREGPLCHHDGVHRVLNLRYTMQQLRDVLSKLKERGNSAVEFANKLNALLSGRGAKSRTTSPRISRCGTPVPNGRLSGLLDGSDTKFGTVTVGGLSEPGVLSLEQKKATMEEFVKFLDTVRNEGDESVLNCSTYLKACKLIDDAQQASAIVFQYLRRPRHGQETPVKLDIPKAKALLKTVSKFPFKTIAGEKLQGVIFSADMWKKKAKQHCNIPTAREIYYVDIEKLSEIKKEGAALALDVTSIQEDLDRALLHMRWLKNVRDELQRKKWSQPNTVIALLNQGTAAHREGREMNQLKGVIGKYRQWKRNTAKAINHQSQNVDTLSALLDTRQTIPLAKCDLMLRLEDRVQITLSWNQRAEGLLAGRDGPVDLNDVRAHIHAGDCIKNMNLPLRIELAGLLRAPDQWFQQVKRTFCKKNTVASTTPEALVQQLQKRLTRSTQNILALRRTYARGSDDRLCVPDCRGEGFMVHCELCQNWYHGVCIKLRPHEVRVSRWFCRECKFANLRQPSEADVTRLVNEGSELNIKLPLLDTLGALLVKGSAWRARARAFLSKESDSELQSICIAMDMLDIDYHNERLLIEGRLKRLEARAEATTVSKAQTKTKESATRLTVPKGISLQAIHSARTQTDSNHKAQVACVSQGPIDTQTASVLLDNLPTSRQGCEAVRDPCTATPASNAPCDVSGDARESGRTDDVTGTEDGDRVLDPKGGESLGQRGSEFGYLRQIGTNCSDRDRGNPKSLEAKTELPADIGIQQLTAILERAGATPEDEDRSISSEDEEEDDMDSARHCVCNLPYKTVEHDCMIQCERCDDWFHNTCVSVTEIQANRDTFVFICPGCIVGINPVAPTAAAAIVSIELPHYQVVPSYNKNTKADEPCPQQSTDTVC